HRALLEEMPAVAYVARVGDPEGSPVFYIGREVEEALGYPREAWTGDQWFWSRHLHPEDRAAAQAWWGAVQAGRIEPGRPTSTEYRIVARDGRAVWFRDRAVIRPGGTIHGVMVEVTEEREARERARRAEGERRRLLERVVEASDRERARLAADLHDGPVQWLTAATLRLRGLRGLLDLGSGEMHAVRELEALLERTARALRELLFQLDPPALEGEGLAAALRGELEGLRAGAGLACRLEDELGGEPPGEVARAAFRIALEALRNVRAHARARSVTLRLRGERGGLSLEVRDDGRGFDPAAPAARGHRGLASMRERAELVGGRLEVESAPGAGTTVRAFLPTCPAGGDAP
ncbi:MAG TPA: ATP-binding protein, partial [Actinomycetota bacterium]|nr:ATP-binding protein [Actinomycetota bacterium]